MRLVIQRVAEASVAVAGEEVSSIGPGLLVFAGIDPEDSEVEVETAVDKLVGLRIFPDEVGKMNLDIGATGGHILVVSQFTLLADVRKGRRPSFTGAARPEEAHRLIDLLVARLVEIGVPTATGVFGAHMDVALVNDGPVTIQMEIREGRPV